MYDQDTIKDKDDDRREENPCRQTVETLLNVLLLSCLCQCEHGCDRIVNQIDVVRAVLEDEKSSCNGNEH